MKTENINVKREGQGEPNCFNIYFFVAIYLYTICTPIPVTTLKISIENFDSIVNLCGYF